MNSFDRDVGSKNPKNFHARKRPMKPNPIVVRKTINHNANENEILKHEKPPKKLCLISFHWPFPLLWFYLLIEFCLADFF